MKSSSSICSSAPTGNVSREIVISEGSHDVSTVPHEALMKLINSFGRPLIVSSGIGIRTETFCTASAPVFLTERI